MSGKEVKANMLTVLFGRLEEGLLSHFEVMDRQVGKEKVGKNPAPARERRCMRNPQVKIEGRSDWEGFYTVFTG